MDEAVTLLVKIIREPTGRKSTITEFQSLIWQNRNPSVPITIWNILKEIALDLDFFETDRNVRNEDPSYFGHKKLEDEVRAGLAKLSDVGIAIPSDINLNREE